MKKSQYHLTDDDRVSFRVPSRKRSGLVRIQVWQAKARVPVVLVSHLPGHVFPDRISAKAANFAYRAILGFPACGMHYYEFQEGRLARALFDLIPMGGGARMCCVNPLYEYVSPGAFDTLIGKNLFGDAVDAAI